jgi:hypothetical protein
MDEDGKEDEKEDEEMAVEKKLRMTKECLKRIEDVVTAHDFCHPIFWLG